MSAAFTQFGSRTRPGPLDVTLLELVRAVSEVTDDEREIVATVLSLLHTGKVRLCGNFRGAPLEDLS